VNAAVWLTGADTAGLLITNDHGRTAEMRACAGRWTVHSANLRARAGHGLNGRILQARKPWKVDDYDSDRSIDFSDFGAILAADGTRSGLGAPVIAGGRLFGVLMVWSRQPAAFQVDATQALVNLAELVASVLMHAARAEESHRDVARLTVQARRLTEWSGEPDVDLQCQVGRGADRLGHRFEDRPPPAHLADHRRLVDGEFVRAQDDVLTERQVPLQVVAMVWNSSASSQSVSFS
jgi:GAF domain-containing protein